MVSLVLAAGFFFATPAHAASRVQTKTTTATAGTTLSVTLDATATAGYMLIAVVGANGSATIAGPAGWSTAINESGTGASQGIFFKRAVGNETTVSASVNTNPGAIGMHVYEYRDVTTFMSATSQFGSGTSFTSGTVTTTAANELVFAAFATHATATITNTTWNDEGFTEWNDFTTAAGGTARDSGYSSGDNLTNTAGAKTVTVTASVTGNWRGQIVRFQNDVTAPAPATLTLSDATLSSIKLTWTAPGDDGTNGTANSYDVRYSTSAITNDTQFNAATAVTGEPAPAAAGTVQTMTVGGLSAGTLYYFAMKTSDEVPNVSALSNSPGLATLSPPDVTAPAPVSDLALSGATVSAITLTWTAPGDDGTSGTATSYDIRRATSPITNDADFAAATQVTGEPTPAAAGTVQTMTVGGLSAGTLYYFAMKTSDEVPNVSSLSNAPGLATLPPPDTTAPAAVSDLAASSPTVTTIVLTWTAPGDDGTSGTASLYDIHYSSSPIVSDADYNAATDVTPSPPAPALAGTVQTMTVTGLSANTTYYFAMKTYDEVPNVSLLSNSPSRATLPAPDVTAPAAVTDLTASSPTVTSILLTWTAPGDDGTSGTATTYDIRYSTAPINDGTFSGATQVAGEPAPAIAGTVQTMTVDSLAANTTYYFAMKTSDEAPNVSALSNTPSQATLPAPDVTAPAAVADLAASSPTTTTILLTWTAPGDDGTSGTAASYDIRYSDEYSITTDVIYNGATQVTGEPTPAVAGTVQTMTVTGLTPNRNYHFAIKTSDEAPNVSALSNSPSLSTLPLPDTTAPAAVTDLTSVPPTTSDSIDLTWTAPGDDGSTGTAAYYDIHYSTSPLNAGNFDAGTHVSGEPVPAIAGTVQTMTVSGLAPNTLYYFAMKTGDEVPNVSAISNVPNKATLPSVDVTAPAAVTDLALLSPTTTSIVLRWTAPGDDGSTGTAASYDIRYSTSPIANGAFATATQVIGEPVPGSASVVQTMTVDGLASGTTYYFAMKTSDEVPNVSALSNAPSLATVSVPDTTAPAAVTDLAASSPTTASILLTWTAPGDDGASGTATTYDIRYATSSIVTNTDFNAATAVTGEPVPAVAGTVQTMTVTGLTAGTTYYFAMKTADEVPNDAALSNAPSLATLTTADSVAPSAVTDLAASSPTTASIVLTWTAPGDDGATGTASSYDIRYAFAPIGADAAFSSAFSVTGEPAPAVAGTVQTMTVTGLTAGTTYYFAMKTSDEASNLSLLSNSPSLSTVAAPAGGGGVRGGASTDLAITAMWGSPQVLPADGGDVTFTYVVKNIGDVHITNISLRADLGAVPCAPVRYASGDDDLDGSLDPDAAWTFTCTTRVAASGAHSAAASGMWNFGNGTSVPASTLVFVGDVTTVPYVNFHATSFPEVLHPEGGTATLLYGVENLGDTPIADPKFSGDFCTLSELLEGDVNGNGLLDPNEEWEYSCAGQFTETVEKFVVFTGMAGEISVTDAQKVTISVGTAAPQANVHLHVRANPSKLPFGGGTTYLHYIVSNDGNVPLTDVEITSGSKTCEAPTYVSGDVGGDGVLGLGESWTYSCIEHLTETEADGPIVRAKAGSRWVTDAALFVVPVSKTVPPKEDATVTGAYDARTALDNNPDIDTSLGLARAAVVSACIPGVPYKVPSDGNPDTEEDTTVFYCGIDGVRHEFPNRKTFLSWYPDFVNVRTMSPSDLRAIPLGVPATYRPGARLLKTPVDPKVYAVARGGVLRWLMDEATAAKAYGADWRMKVDDLPVQFMDAHYRIGAPLDAASVGAQ